MYLGLTPSRRLVDIVNIPCLAERMAPEFPVATLCSDLSATFDHARAGNNMAYLTLFVFPSKSSIFSCVGIVVSLPHCTCKRQVNFGSQRKSAVKSLRAVVCRHWFQSRVYNHQRCLSHASPRQFFAVNPCGGTSSKFQRAPINR